MSHNISVGIFFSIEKRWNRWNKGFAAGSVVIVTTLLTAVFLSNIQHSIFFQQALRRAVGAQRAPFCRRSLKGVEHVKKINKPILRNTYVLLLYTGKFLKPTSFPTSSHPKDTQALWELIPIITLTGRKDRAGSA